MTAYRWINWHLKNDNAEVHEPPLPKFEGTEAVYRLAGADAQPAYTSAFC